MSAPSVLPGRLLVRLLAHGQLDPAAVMARGVVITDVSRSNPVHLVWVDGEPTWFVKQAGPTIDGIDPILAEHRAYDWLVRSGMGEIAPSRFGPSAEWLCLDAVVGAVPLHAVVAAHGWSVGGPAVFELAHLLAALHAAPTGGSLRRSRPWVLGLERGLPSAMVGLDHTAQRAREFVQRSAIGSALRRASRAWSATSVIHADIKFDNVLVAGQAPDGLRIWLIDWELSGLGDPRWDVAGIVDGVVVPEILATGRVSSAVRRVLAEALGRYGAGGRWAEDLAPFVVARLLQTAIQLSAMAEQRNGEDVARADDGVSAVIDALPLVVDLIREIGRQHRIAA